MGFGIARPLVLAPPAAAERVCLRQHAITSLGVGARHATAGDTAARFLRSAGQIRVRRRRERSPNEITRAVHTTGRPTDCLTSESQSDASSPTVSPRGVTASPTIVTVIAYRTSQSVQCTSADCSLLIPSGVCVSVVPHPHSNVSGSPGIPAHYPHVIYPHCSPQGAIASHQPSGLRDALASGPPTGATAHVSVGTRRASAEGRLVLGRVMLFLKRQ